MAMKIPVNLLLLFIFTFFSCNGPHQNNQTGSSADKKIKSDPKPSGEPHVFLQFKRTTPSVNPAYFQYNLHFAPSGSPFDPKFAPTSTGESSGTLIYTDHIPGKTGIWVLIAQENQGKQPWNFMRGSVDKGDSFVTAAIKELNQETAGAYETTESVLLSESYDVYHSATHNNYACTFFVKMDYVSAVHMRKSAKTHSDHHFKEMQDYEWIPMADLIHAIHSKQSDFSAITAEGKKKNFSFYRYSFNILVQAHGHDILNHLK